MSPERTAELLGAPAEDAPGAVTPKEEKHGKTTKARM